MNTKIYLAPSRRKSSEALAAEQIPSHPKKVRGYSAH